MNEEQQEEIVEEVLPENETNVPMENASNNSIGRAGNRRVISNSSNRMQDIAATRLNNLASKTPYGRVANKVAKIAGDKEGLGSVNSNLSMAKGRKNAKAGDVAAAQKLKNTKSSRLGKIKSLIDKRKSDSSTAASTNTDGNNATNDINEDNENQEDENIVAKKRFIKIVLAIASLVLPLLLIVVIVGIVMIITVVPSSVFKPVLSIFEYENTGNKDLYLINTEDEENRAKELSYYSKLESLKGSYTSKCEKECEKKHIRNCIINLDNNYVHAALIYIHYKIDFPDDLEDDAVQVDYDRMNQMSGTIYEIMAGESCDVDYSVGGEFYTKLSESASFKKYYEEILKEESVESVLNDIFEIAQNIEISNDEPSNIIVSPKLTVNNSGDKISAKEYLTGVIYNKLDKDQIKNSELVKAYTIYYTTNALYQGNLSKDNLTLTINNNDYCNVNSNCNGKGSITSDEKSSIQKNIDAVYGNVLLNKQGNVNYLDTTLAGKATYQEMLTESYPEYKITNLLENSYDSGANYGTTKTLTTVYFYEQSDYANVAFCGRKNATIKTSGCGTTSMAMVVSTYQNSNKYDPVYEMNRAYKWGYCGKGISGTSPAFFKKEAKEMKYKYLKVGKSKTSDLDLVLSHLAKGDLVIAHMGPGHFTSGGHYMVLGGVDPTTKKVYVYDPYNKSNKANKKRKTGNGWYSLNDMIAKEAYAFYIIWKG